MENERPAPTVRRACNGTDLVELAAAGSTRNRTLRHVATYLHELGPDDRARVCGKVAELLEKSARLDRTFAEWLRETDNEERK